MPPIETMNGTKEKPASTGTINSCRCRKSKCLKLYCDCFAAGQTCSPLCKCTSCENTWQQQRVDPEVTMVKLLPSVQPKLVPVLSSPVVKRACNCRRSGCRKKYCECFSAGMSCTKACRCVECVNDGRLAHPKDTCVHDWVMPGGREPTQSAFGEESILKMPSELESPPAAPQPKLVKSQQQVRPKFGSQPALSVDSVRMVKTEAVVHQMHPRLGAWKGNNAAPAPVQLAQRPEGPKPSLLDEWSIEVDDLTDGRLDVAWSAEPRPEQLQLGTQLSEEQVDAVAVAVANGTHAGFRMQQAQGRASPTHTSNCSVGMNALCLDPRSNSQSELAEPTQHTGSVLVPPPFELQSPGNNTQLVPCDGENDPDELDQTRFAKLPRVRAEQRLRRHSIGAVIELTEQKPMRVRRRSLGSSQELTESQRAQAMAAVHAHAPLGGSGSSEGMELEPEHTVHSSGQYTVCDYSQM